jgi:hypothetical protein
MLRRGSAVATSRARASVGRCARHSRPPHRTRPRLRGRVLRTQRAAACARLRAARLGICSDRAATGAFRQSRTPGSVLLMSTILPPARGSNGRSATLAASGSRAGVRAACQSGISGCTARMPAKCGLLRPKRRAASLPGRSSVGGRGRLFIERDRSYGLRSRRFQRARRPPLGLMCPRRTRRPNPRRMGPARSRNRTAREQVPMFPYTCPSCGACAYSSANASTAGSCPRCAGPLVMATAEPDLASAAVTAARR